MSTTEDGNERRHHEIAAAPYAVLTRDVGGGFSGPRADSSGGARGGGLGPIVTKALQDVLGWKINALDYKGFANALNQSFNSPVTTRGLRRSSATLRLPVSTSAWVNAAITVCSAARTPATPLSW